jgi:hypothetical protein
MLMFVACLLAGCQSVGVDRAAAIGASWKAHANVSPCIARPVATPRYDIDAG